MNSENANSQITQELINSPEFLNQLALTLMPAIGRVAQEAVSKSLALLNSPTMSKENFCAANNISASLLEKWIRDGVVLLAPTPTTTVRRKVHCPQTRKLLRVDVMEKHGNALINVAAWREKNHQHALKCRYIKP